MQGWRCKVPQTPGNDADWSQPESGFPWDVEYNFSNDLTNIILWFIGIGYWQNLVVCCYSNPLGEDIGTPSTQVVLKAVFKTWDKNEYLLNELEYNWCYNKAFLVAF